MTFTSQDNANQHFEVIQQYLLNKVGFTSAYRIVDGNRVTPYHFTCPVCNNSSTNIDCSNSKWVESMTIRIDWEAIKALGGTGDMGKLISCDNCQTPYFIGIGYAEPNYGRDVFFLHTIIELKELGFTP